MRKFLLVLIIAVMLIGIVSASQESLPTQIQNTCITLPQTCSNCTYMNITSVIYPDLTQALGEVAMVKSGTFYNYSSFCNTNQIGRYIVNGKGNLNGVETIWTYDFQVGESNTTLFIILSFASVILLMFAFIFKNYAFSEISGFAFLVTGVYSMIYGFGGTTNQYTRMISVIIIALGAIITIISSLDLIKESEGNEQQVDYSSDEEE